MASRLKYQVGQRFRCLVPQRLVLGMANGVPVPFGQVASDTKRTRAHGIDVPVGTIIVLEADFQCRLPDGTTKRAYVLRVEGQPTFFVDRVLTRKYERIIIDPHERAILVGAASILEEEDARIMSELTALTPEDVKLLQGVPVPIQPMIPVTIEEEEGVWPGVIEARREEDARFVQAILSSIKAEAEPSPPVDATARGVSFIPSGSQDDQGEA